MLNISTGVVNRAKRVGIYAGEGVGKTTLAAAFPNPLFIDTEGGTAHMDVRRIDRPGTWEELVEIVEEVARTPGICQTLVLDTADWAEHLAIDKVCRDYKLKSIEGANYGRGYTYLSDEFKALLRTCDKVIDAGIHVVITAHAKMRKFEQPDEMGAYDRWEMKLSKQVAPLLKEWTDILLFLNYKTFVVTSESNTNKVQGGKRVMYTTHHPCWDAKNRYGLPEILDLDYRYISHLFGNGGNATASKGNANTANATNTANSTKSALDELHDLMEKDGVTEAEVRKVVAEKGHYREDEEISTYAEKFVKGWLIAHWDKVLELIVNGRKSGTEEA